MYRLMGWALTLVFVLPLAAYGQGDCSDGTIHDDGSFENGYGASPEGNFAHFVMRVDPPAVPTTIESFCLCWTRLGGDSTVDYDIHVWDSDGPGGGPGTLLGSLESTQAAGVASFPGLSFFRHNVTGGPTINGPVYVGPEWSTALDQDFFLCADENGPTSQPGFFEVGILAGIFPPEVPIVAGFPDYRNLGVRVVFADLAPEPTTLSDSAGLIVPGFEVDLSDPDGPGTLFAVRNTTDSPRTVEVNYYPFDVRDAPLRTDTIDLGPQENAPVNVGTNVSGLLVENNMATGLILINQAGGGADDLQGDYFRVDFTNDFATGDRMVRPEELCAVQEIRYVNFGGGTQLRLLLDDPPLDAGVAFTYTAYAGDGSIVVDEGEFFTSNNLVLVDQEELVPGQNFGTLVLDFSPSGSGWASAEYSAFGRFSLELNSACVQQAAAAAAITTDIDPAVEKARRHLELGHDSAPRNEMAISLTDRTGIEGQ